MRRVVVTGLGMINSLGQDKESAFSAIIEGKCGIRTIESFDTQGQSVTIAGEIEGFDPLSVLDAKEAKKADRFIQLALKAGDEAMKDAKLPEDTDMERFGVASASGIGGLPNIEKIKVMEFLWDELTFSKDKYSSPTWHKNALRETEKRMLEGKEDAIDWNEAKQLLRNDFS
jgi:3-oxoacyl-(acyl-carrier-protein) synthase